MPSFHEVFAQQPSEEDTYMDCPLDAETQSIKLRDALAFWDDPARFMVTRGDILRQRAGNAVYAQPPERLFIFIERIEEHTETSSEAFFVNAIVAFHDGNDNLIFVTVDLRRFEVVEP